MTMVWATFGIARLHPRQLLALLGRRLGTEGAFGVACTAGLTGLILVSWLLGGLLQELFANPVIARMDSTIVLFVAESRVGWLTADVMYPVSLLGRAAFVAVFAAIAGLSLSWRTGRWRPLVLLMTVAGGVGLLDLVVKPIIARPRPPLDWMVVTERGYGFPSGHATVSAVYFMLAYLEAELTESWANRVLIFTCAGAVGFLLGVSRIYLGVHWPTDVVGGWMLAAAWFTIVSATASALATLRRQ